MSEEYPSDWDSRRKQVYKRDNYICQNCGAKGGDGKNTELHAHHIVPKSRDGSHSLSNLKTLCSDCHSRVHGYPVGKVSNSRAKNKDGNLLEILLILMFDIIATLFLISPILIANAMMSRMGRFEEIAKQRLHAPKPKGISFHLLPRVSNSIGDSIVVLIFYIVISSSIWYSFLSYHFNEGSSIIGYGLVTWLFVSLILVIPRGESSN